MKNRHSIIATILLTHGFLALGPAAQAVNPAPDGGYAGFNTAEGTSALFNLTTGIWNTALGGQALFYDTTGGNNTAVGLNALYFNVMGANNTATGAQALQSNIASGNTANGYQALFRNTTGGDNTATGDLALARNTTGTNNTAVGSGALFYNTRGNNNIALGINAGNGVTTAVNVICIGATGNNVSDSCYIGKIFNATSSGGATVFVNSNGRLGTITSSRRFKECIEPMGDASEALFSLEPVSFRYKKAVDPESPEGGSQFGLVAEDVAKVNPDLVVRDNEGKPYSVRYDQVNAMLLNEFLKEHRTVQELKGAGAKQDATIAVLTSMVVQQQNSIKTLIAQVKEQAAQIQKVGARIEVSSTAAQRVVRDR